MRDGGAGDGVIAGVKGLVVGDGTKLAGGKGNFAGIGVVLTGGVVCLHGTACGYAKQVR